MGRYFILCFFALLFNNGILNAQETNEESDEHELKSTNCGGVERWSVKVLTDASASQVNYTPVLITLNELVHIATPTPSTTATRISGLEFKTYKFRCHITRKKSESDNDFHIVVSDSTYTMVTEIPDPVCSEASLSAHVNEYIAARQFIATYIPLTPDYNVNIPEVSITGVAFLDPPHGQTGEALNHLEMHPILDIHFWTEADTNATANVNAILPEAILKVNIYPNVFSSSAELSINTKNPILGNCMLELFASDGRKVKDINLAVTNNNQINYTLNRDNLSSGMYIYRIINNNTLLYDGKIVIQ